MPAPDLDPSSNAEVSVADSLTRRDRIFAMAGVLTALLLAGLDQTIVATAGPEIQRSLRIPAGLYVWITTAYLVASTVMLPIWGKLSDLYGRKPILLAGVGLFLLGSVLCGFAPGTMPLIAARAVQGLGAGSLFTTALAVIGDLFPPAQRGKYMGLIGGVMGISSVIGPLVGGIITDALGWQWIFFVNLPVGAVALWIIVARMPKLVPPRRDAKIDFAGAAWLMIGVVPLLVALSLGGARATPGTPAGGFASPVVLGLLLLAVVGIIGFILAERRAVEPVLDLALFRNRVIGAGTAAMFVLGATFLFTMIFLPLYLVNVVGVSVTGAGLSMVPLTIGMVTGSVGGGQLVSRLGHYRPLLLGSLVLLAVAFAIMGFTLGVDSTPTGVTLRMILVGLGIGPSLPLFTLILQNAGRPEDLGVVTAAATFSRSVGQVIGVTVFGGIFAATLAASLPRRVEAVLETLPPHLRQVVTAASPAFGSPGQGTGIAFDPAGAHATVRRSLSVAAGITGAATGTHTLGPNGGTAADQDLVLALAAVDEIGLAFAGAITDAIRRLYQVGLGMVFVALGLTALIPEIPLRRHQGRTPAAPGPTTRNRAVGER